MSEEDDSDRIEISGLLYDLLIDVAEICKQEGYWEELDVMENLNKTHSQMLMEKSKLENSISIAKKMFGKMSMAEIAQITGLPLEKIEELVPNA